MSNQRWRGARSVRGATAVLGVVLVGATVLAGCAASGPDSAAPPTVTQTVTASPGGTSHPESTAPSSASAPSAPSSSAPSSATTAGSATVPLCGTPDLHATAFRQRGGGTAGATTYELSLVNDGAVCRTEGWPGVSFVGGPDGTQVGAAADRVQTDQERSVTLIPGARAVTTLRIADPDAYGAQCDATRARGLRVYPPDNRQSLFVSLPSRACASSGVHLLQVAPVHPVS